MRRNINAETVAPVVKRAIDALRMDNPQYVARPPETSNTAPVENDASRLANQHTKDATSSTSPNRPIGIFDSI